MKKPINIKDLAKAAGVSQSTISRALNDKSDISQETKERIRKLAKELGYRPNITAKRLVQQKTNTIGVFILTRDSIDLEENSALKYVEVILNEIKKKDYDLILFSVDHDKPETSYLDICIERAVEGAIFIGFSESDTHIDEIKDFDIPAIFVERNVASKNSCTVITDNEKAMKIGLDYLFRLGHKNIGFLRGIFDTEVANIRKKVFREVMEKKNLYNENYIFDGNFSLESGYNAASQLAMLEDLPTAIFCSSDLEAIGLMRGLRDYRIKVPEDISILGFDGFKVGNFMIPRLSTIEQDFASIAIKSIDALFNLIEGKETERVVQLPPKLLVRESCKALEE